MTKIQMTETLIQQHRHRSFMSLEHSNFEFVSNFDIRISDLQGRSLGVYAFLEIIQAICEMQHYIETPRTCS